MMRQHVNPLSRFFQLPLALPEPYELFDHPNLPIHLDIGCARGFFLLELAALQPGRNHLGVEIRRSLVQAAQRDRNRYQQNNLHFLFCNANISLEDWMAALPPDQLHLVTIQFPDPWFKQRHRKRRVLQPDLLLAIASALNPGRQLFLQSDVLAVIEPMVSLVELSSCFVALNKITGLGEPIIHCPSPQNESATCKGRDNRPIACSSSGTTTSYLR
jgi:tRNA (guanine-N7-)-methyltransferase